ncbi:MAG: hypothetical protein HQ592_00495 [Planctomycetes bacterium]|nr:hypothetical protein [Planctomycetota bacterium]
MKAITILNASVCLVALLACHCLNVVCCNAAGAADIPGPVRDLAFADDTGACADDGITNDSELVFTWSPPEAAADVAGNLMDQIGCRRVRFCRRLRGNRFHEVEPRQCRQHSLWLREPSVEMKGGR